MLMEALVIVACLQGKGGCSESTSAYYKSNKDAQVIVENVEALGKRVTKGNEWLVYVATPIYAIAAGQPANIFLHKEWILGINLKKELIALQWSY
jgi:hypothetical protein